MPPPLVARPVGTAVAAAAVGGATPPPLPPRRDSRLWGRHPLRTGLFRQSACASLRPSLSPAPALPPTVPAPGARFPCSPPAMGCFFSFFLDRQPTGARRLRRHRRRVDGRTAGGTALPPHQRSRRFHGALTAAAAAGAAGPTRRVGSPPLPPPPLSSGTSVPNARGHPPLVPFPPGLGGVVEATRCRGGPAAAARRRRRLGRPGVRGRPGGTAAAPPAASASGARW